MVKFIEFRHLQEHLSDIDSFLALLEDEMKDKSGVDIVNIIKAMGIQLNPYPGKHKYLKLLSGIDELFKNHFDEIGYKYWIETKYQSKLLNDLFNQVYLDEKFKALLDLDGRLELESFIIMTEQALTKFRGDMLSILPLLMTTIIRILQKNMPSMISFCIYQVLH